MNKKELLVVYIQKNEITRDKNTNAKILSATEYAHLIGVIGDQEFEFYKLKYQKSITS